MELRCARRSFACLALALSASPALAGGTPALDLSADLRLRLEQDWDSRTAAGVERPERTRARIRARFNAKADLGSGVSFVGRVRTDGDGSQQNANITFWDFDHGSEDKLKLAIDRYEIAWKGKAGGVEAGRMLFPFFTQNEYFWDGDIDRLGVAGNFAVPLDGAARLRINGGGFALPVALHRYSGRLYAGQTVIEAKTATLAAGLFRFDADRKDADRLRLLDGNGSRDYSVLALNAQYRIPAGKRAVTLGADYYRNLESYAKSTDAVSRANRNQRTGYVLSAAWGDTGAPGHLQIGYRYSHVEKLALDASYAHDDIERFGTAAQAALTDLEGHDIYANYAITKRLTIGARTMLMKRITTTEDGKRARLDLSYSF